jgi:sulfite oxidase
MPGKTERSLEQLYQDDRERADAVAFGRRTGLDRRGFLGGTGLAAMGVAVGGSIPFAEHMPAGLIPAAFIPAAMAQTPRRSTNSSSATTARCRSQRRTPKPGRSPSTAR